MIKTSPKKIAYIKKWRAEHPDKVREYGRTSDQRRRKEKIAYWKKWAKKNKDKIRKNFIKHRGKFEARAKLRDFTSRGKVKKLPCEKCGNPKSEGHHYKGYLGKNWKKVMWLCRKHHMEFHRK